MGKVYTIGFTGSSAENFFARLQKANVKKVIDTRLWPSTQLSGFAKKQDLPFFLKSIGNIGYEYRQDLAPSEDILKAYKDNKIDWHLYEQKYITLLEQRNVPKVVQPVEVTEPCFLCACKTEHQCHRRLLAEYLQAEWDNGLEIVHL